MALKSPLLPSPTAAFSPSADSPTSPAPYSSAFAAKANRTSANSDSLAPPPSPYPQSIEPSPVDSNGTDKTEIDEDAQEDAELKSPMPAKSPDIEISSPQSAHSRDSARPQHKINTHVPNRSRSDSQDEAPQSVIHAPNGFKEFEPTLSTQTSPAVAERFDHTVVSPRTPEAALSPNDKKLSSVSPVNTNIPRYVDQSTPRAQTRHELDEEHEKRKSRRTSSLEDIPEAMGQDPPPTDDQPSTAGLGGNDTMIEAGQALSQAEKEVAALRTALSECWTLCNTLAGLSSSHRHRTFKFAGRQEQQEQAWRSCWRLCQQLYDSRDEDHASQVTPTLELCRDFCQSLFEARQKGDPAADSVLRVSFELNNHLYNTHDRNLPDAFNERTLDFYITLCHRLMKQRTSLPHETDALLRACWSLAEMLFNLRQNNKEGKSPDEELLGSAVQACWELCDLFREGWTQIRPERTTPRPSQTTFLKQHNTSASASSTRSTERSSSSLSGRAYHDAPSLPPETPTTIFDDATTATSSPDSAVNVPNILVLGPASTGSNGSKRGGHHERWSSNASVISGYSESASSQRTSSTATAGSEEAHLARLRALLLKAGVKAGFDRTSGQQLTLWAETLPTDAFGTLPWQMKVLTIYKKLVLNDKSLLNVHAAPQRRLQAGDVAKSVRWLGSSEQWAWMRDLYRLVFGFGVEEGERRGGGGSVQI